MKKLKSQKTIKIQYQQSKKLDNNFFGKNINKNIKKQKNTSYKSTKISKRNSIKGLFS